MMKTFPFPFMSQFCISAVCWLLENPICDSSKLLPAPLARDYNLFILLWRQKAELSNRFIMKSCLGERAIKSLKGKIELKNSFQNPPPTLEATRIH